MCKRLPVILIRKNKMPVIRRKRSVSTAAPARAPSLLRRMQQEATNKYNNLRDSHLSNLTNYRWMRYVIALWTFRMVFVAVGFLFPILSLLSSSKQEIVSFELEDTDWSKSNASFVRNLLSREVPFLFTHAPVPDSSVIGYLLLSYMPSMIANIKQSSSGHFMYYSSEQQWSSKISDKGEYSYVEYKKEDFISELSSQKENCVVIDESEDEAESKKYLYFSQFLQRPSTNQILLNFAPHLLNLPTSIKGIDPEFRLWLSSEGSKVSPHYDMEHNFFMQVNGTKTFLIGSPSLAKLFQPHSNLHPHWRQGQLSHLMNVDDVYEHVLNSTSESICSHTGNITSTGIQKNVISDSLKSLLWGPTCREPFTISKQPRQYRKSKSKSKRKQVDSGTVDNKIDDGEVESSSLSNVIEHDNIHASEEDVVDTKVDDSSPTVLTDTHNSAGSLYEVTLHPGDILYIPPFYFHAVTSHSYSVSINSWIGSRFLVLSDSLKNIDLPYREKSPPLVQMSAVAAMVKMVWSNLNNPIGMNYFASLMRDRHDNSHFDSDFSPTHSCLDSGGSECALNEEEVLNTDTVELPPCTLKSLRRAGVNLFQILACVVVPLYFHDM